MQYFISKAKDQLNKQKQYSNKISNFLGKKLKKEQKDFDCLNNDTVNNCLCEIEKIKI